jgi:Uma2 family endonuclease
MANLLVSSPEIPTLGKLLDRLGGISADRVRYFPLPGTATVADVAEIHDREGRTCELIDGVLVEKQMGWNESMIAGAIISALRAFVMPRKLGYVTGEAGTTQIVLDLVRIPDVAFVSRARLPHGLPREPVPLLVPDLAVEVLSLSNTPREMDRKRREYFESGVRLCWCVDIRTRTVAVYTSPGDPQVFTEQQTLNGGDVLPEFILPLASLFAELDD